MEIDREYHNLDVEEINDFDGMKYVSDCHYGVKFHSYDGKEIKMLIEYTDNHTHENLVIYENEKEVFKIKFAHALSLSEFAKALYFVARAKDCDEINEYAWCSAPFHPGPFE